MNDLPVAHPRFRSQKLVVRPAGLVSGAKLLLNGAEVPRVKGLYSVRDDAGQDVAVRLKAVIPDPVPVVVIDGEPVRLARPFAWYEYVWMALPLVLLVGGALGGALGAGAAYANAHVLRSEAPVWQRFGLSAGITIGAIAVFAVLAAMLQSATGPTQR